MKNMKFLGGKKCVAGMGFALVLVLSLIAAPDAAGYCYCGCLAGNQCTVCVDGGCYWTCADAECPCSKCFACTTPECASFGCGCNFCACGACLLHGACTCSGNEETDSPHSTTEPIDTRTGSNYFTEERMFVPCPGIPLKFDMKYQSIANRAAGVLGEGWQHSYEWSLDVQSGHAVLHAGGGGNHVFAENPDGTYSSPRRNGWTLEETSSGHEAGMPGGLAYGFNTNGQLSAIHDAWGTGVACSYETNGCLETVAHDNGRELVFSNAWHAASSEWRLAGVRAVGGASLEFTYNSDGQLAQIVEQVGSTTHTSCYQYAAGFLTNKVNGAGFEYAFAYEPGSGKGTHLEVDGYYPHDVSYLDASTTEVVYHRQGGEQVFRYSRNAGGTLGTKYGPAETAAAAGQRGVWYDYSTDGIDTTRETRFDNNTGTTFSRWMLYDDAHNLTNMSAAYCSEVPSPLLSLEYDPVWHLPSAIEDGGGARLEIAYANGSPSVLKAFHSETNSHDTCFGYTADGLLQALTNANGHVACFGHDAMGNTVSVAAELGPTITNAYNSLGFVRSTEILSEGGASTGRITQYDRNAKGWIERVVFADGLTNSYMYNALGYITSTVDRAGRVTGYTYAPTRKLTSVTKYLEQGGCNVPVRIGYDLDEQVNLLRISEPRGRYVESYHLDIQDRVTSVTNIEDQVMDIDYSLGNFIEQVVRFDGTTITNTYNAAGRKSSVSYLAPGNQQLATINYSHYADGQLESLSDGTSTISNRFDRLNRLTQRSSSSPALEYGAYYNHDPVGNVTGSEAFYYRNSWQWVSIYTDHTYDEAERLKTRGSHAFAYSPDNGRIAMVSNTVDGITCSHGYDIMNRLTNITYRTASGSLIRSLDYAYDASSMIIQKRISNTEQGTPNSEVNYTYDSLDRLTGETSTTNGHSLFDIQYSYDLAGNRLTRTADGLGVAYALGTGNRLASAGTIATIDLAGSSTEPVGTNDCWGELWVSNLNAQAGWVPQTDDADFWVDDLHLVPGTNRLVAAIRDLAGNMDYTTNTVFFSAEEEVQSFAYDAAGCMTNLNGVSLEWDERYRLTNSTVSTASTTSTVSYAYDVFGRKTSRTVSGSTEHYIHEGNHVLADLYANLWYHRIYAYGPGIDNILTMTVYPSDGNTANAVVYHYIKDHQNSVIAVTDDSGSVVESYEYDAYGRVLDVKDGSGNSIGNQQSAIGNRFLFQGREYDWNTGLYHFRARWYDPGTGRWLSKDPIGIRGGLNQYVFCGNNPVNFIDPFGLDEEGVDWDQIKEGLGQMGKASLQILGGIGLAMLDLGLPVLDVAAAVVVTEGIADATLGYADVVGGFIGVDTSDVPNDTVDGFFDAATGNDEIGDAAQDIFDAGADAVGNMGQ